MVELTTDDSMDDGDVMEKATELRVVKKSGGCIVKYPGCFSTDSKLLFIPCGNCIHSYGTETAELISIYGGLEKDAIGVSLLPSDPSKIVSVSCEGELVVWRYAKEVNNHLTIDRKIMLGKEIKRTFWSFSMIQQHDDGERSYVVCVTNEETKPAYVKTFCSVTGEEVAFFPKLRVECNSRCMTARYHDGEILLAAYTNSKDPKKGTDPCVTVCVKQKNEPMSKRNLMSLITFTCVACHPTELCVLAGDSIGNIRVYYGLIGDRAPYASCHWHTLPVVSIGFSSYGKYFFSGGGECTVVRWYSPKKKKFLARLPGEITWIVSSSDNCFLAVSTNDNGIQLVDSSYQICGHIQHFSVSTPTRDNHYVPPSEMAFDPRSQTLVLNARVGHLQFFSLEQEKSLFLLDITCRNYLTQERAKVIINTEVVKLAFNTDGSWLATVEFCEDRKAPIDLRVKFWEFNKKKQKYVLNTSAEDPHRGEIYAVRFHPSTKNETLMCITIGEDKKFRIWTLKENSTKDGFSWRSDTIGYYRDLPGKALSFSVDGSLVAITFGPTLTLWLPGINQMKSSLTPANITHDLSHVEFGQKSVHLVVTGSKEGLAVWNILTLSLVWVARFDLCVLVSDPESDVMAAFSSTSDVVVFSPKSHEPIFQQNQILPDSEERITNAVFVPVVDSKTQGVSWQKSSQLYFLNSSQELLSFENPVQDDTNGEEEKLDVMPSTSYRPVTPYSAIIAKQIKSDIIENSKETQLQVGTPGFKSLQDFMEGPAHTMPPLSFLAKPLMLSFIAKKDEDPYSARAWRYPFSEEEMEMSDDSDLEPETLPNSVSQEPTSDSLTPESENKLSEIEKKLTAIQSLSLDWVSQLLRRNV